MLIELTTRQRQILAFIRDHVDAKGYPPTVREIGRHFGIKSPNGVLCHLKALEKKGHVRRSGRGRCRALTLATPPAELLVRGTIAAGSPVQAVECPEPAGAASLLAAGNGVLRVTDDSLAHRLVRRGDYVVRGEDGREIGVIRRVGIS